MKFALILLFPLLALSQSDKAKLPGEDWVSLFNGTDLSGWVKIGNESWTVEDGVIHGKGITKDYGYLQTEKSFQDFQLSLQQRRLFPHRIQAGHSRRDAGAAV
jgi:hypothetical protein